MLPKQTKKNGVLKKTRRLWSLLGAVDIWYMGGWKLSKKREDPYVNSHNKSEGWGLDIVKKGVRS